MVGFALFIVWIGEIEDVGMLTDTSLLKKGELEKNNLNKKNRNRVKDAPKIKFFILYYTIYKQKLVNSVSLVMGYFIS
jgi:hypothetical protein